MPNRDAMAAVIERSERREAATRAENAAVLPLKRAVRRAERMAGDGSEIGGTGFTVLKIGRSPVAWLVDQKKIGQEEVRSADEICEVYLSTFGVTMIRPPTLERHDRSHGYDGPNWLIDAEARYKRFANFWSGLWKSESNPMLDILIAGVVDERSLRSIEDDHRLKHGRAAKIIAAGLRDYAARAGWVDAKTVILWKSEARKVSRRTNGKEFS